MSRTAAGLRSQQGPVSETQGAGLCDNGTGEASCREKVQAAPPDLRGPNTGLWPRAEPRRWAAAAPQSAARSRKPGRVRRPHGAGVSDTRGAGEEGPAASTPVPPAGPHQRAFALVSKLLSQCKLDLLEELVSKEVLQVLEEKLSSLSENHRNALAADMDEIMYTTAGDVGIYYDDSGRKFVSILMCFWYLTSADLPDEAPDGTKVFQIVFGDKTVKETKRLLTANYEFRREFTQGVKADWTITRIEHPKLLE